MVTQLADLFPILLLSALASLLLAPLWIAIGPRVGLMDRSGSAPHKIHSSDTPAVGGPVIGLALALAYGILRLSPPVEVIWIFVGALLVLTWGMIDDRLDLIPWQKLLGQALAAALMILAGIQVRVTRIQVLDVALTIIWFIGMENAFNFVDSMDGLALGLAAVASSFFMLVMLDSDQPQLSILAAALLGACLGAFVFNASPARLFLGDSGSQLLGFILAALGVAYVPAGAGLPQGVSWFTPILVLGVPIYDMAMVVMSRLRRGAPIYRGGQDHLYHRLLVVGFDSTRSVLFMQIAAVGLGLIAFIALNQTVFIANLIFGLIVLIGLVGLIYLEGKK